MGTSVAVNFLRILAMVATLWGIRSVRLRPWHYLLLLVVGDVTYSYSSIHGFGNSVTYLILYLVFLVLTKWMKNDGVEILLTWIAGASVFYLYNFIYENFVREIYFGVARKYGLSALQKGMLLGSMTVVLVSFLCVVILFLKKLLLHYLEQWKEFSESYRELSHYLVAIPFLFGISLLFVEVLPRFTYYETPVLRLGSGMLLLVFLAMQVFYLRMLVRTITLRERMKQRELEQDQLLLYNRDLNQNMQEIRAMKHDLKNIFLTMGEYVNRSEDKELREYYQEKIAPFAQEEMQKNDLYVQLQQLDNESLRAFLYYKIQQGIHGGAEVQLEINLDGSLLSKYEWKTALWRILGIFLDNAMEECKKLSHGNVVIRITEQEQKLCFQIKNQVTPESRRNGIHPGTSTKGLGRGNGLVIVERLVKQNRDILWNSYFQEDYFVQSILLS